MSPIKILSGIILLLVLIVAMSSLFVVSEGQQALLLFLGKIETNAKTQDAKIFTPGIHTRLPIVTEVEKFDVRLQTTLDDEPARVFTKEKKALMVDYYIKWRIHDLASYYTSTGGVKERAETLLRQRMNNGLRAQFGQHTVQEVISGQRESIMNVMKKQLQQSAKNLGIGIVDVRIKAIDFPDKVSESVYDRMRADRESAATRHRALGQSLAEAIRADADAQKVVTLATAQEKAAQLRADGDAAAAKIYANAYNKDAEFYAFYRSMLAYQQVFKSKNNMIVLQPDSQFFGYFNQAKTNGTSGKTMTKTTG